MSKLLITGASGFVGSALLSRCALENYEVRAVVRKEAASQFPKVEYVLVNDLSKQTDWCAALEGVDVVIHLAARAHILDESSPDPLADFRSVNVAGALSFALQSAMRGVKRFIFISSIGVNGVETFSVPYAATSKASPRSFYAISKWEAEVGLSRIAQETGMEMVIIRPPLVYGPNAPGNFGRLFNIVARGFPLPLGAIHNQRSLVALDNLVHLIITCIDHPAAANQTFLVSDGEDLSTTELLRRTAQALGKPARLIPVPQRLLEAGLKLIGKADLAQRLCGSLQVDTRKTREVLDWTPPVSVDEALKKTAEDFLAKMG